MENNTNRAPTEVRPPSASPAAPPVQVQQQQPPPQRPPLQRLDSRSLLQQQQQFPQQQQQQQQQHQLQQRPVAPPQYPQHRPQFQPGGPVTNPPQFAPRPGTPVPRGPVTSGPPGSQPPPGYRIQVPGARPQGPQPYMQQGPRPLQQQQGPQQRVPPPNNLQFGPRQPPQFGAPTTPEAAKPLVSQLSNGSLKNGVQQPINQSPQVSRQSSQGSIKGLDLINQQQPKAANLDNQNIVSDNQNATRVDTFDNMATKSRSYSIAAPAGAPSPLKLEDDRRKSISGFKSNPDEPFSKVQGLGLIQENKTESSDDIVGSKEAIKTESFSERFRIPRDGPNSLVASSKMTDSIIGSLSASTVRPKEDDDNDVVSLNTQSGKSNVNISDSFNRSNITPGITEGFGIKQPPLYQNTIPSTNQSSKPTPQQNGSSEQSPYKTNDSSKESANTAPPVKSISKSPLPDQKPPIPAPKKPTDFNTETNKLINRKTASAPKSRTKDGDNDSGVDESTQGNDLNGSPGSPNKKTGSKLPLKEKSSGSIKQGLSRSSSKSATARTPENPPPAEKKKIPMNKIQVGNAPSPNIKAVKSKIGSLENATYKPGGGKVKIENKKIELQNVTPRIAAKNDTYVPSGGTKKITTAKLEWNAKSKIGSLQNTSYKPGGGDKKIETVKLDFKEKAKPKVASTVNITHKPGGGTVKFIKWAIPRWRASHKHFAFHDLWKKIENQKLEFKAQSKVGSLDNVKHKPKGGDVKIFDDKEYIRQMSAQSGLDSHTNSRQEDDYDPQDYEDQERPLSRCVTARTPRARGISPHHRRDDERVLRNNERNRRTARPASARSAPRSACTRGGPLSSRPAFTVY